MGVLEQHAEYPGYPLIPSSSSIPPAPAAPTAHIMAAEEASAAHPLLLQMPASHMTLLQSIMQRELQALTPQSHQLQLARRIQQELQLSTARAGQQQPQQQQQQGTAGRRVEVVPLLGRCVVHLVASNHQSLTQQPEEDAAAHGELFESMAQYSPFLNALQSELCSLRNVSGSCYSHIKQQLAAVGQHLPPAAAAADDSGRRSRSSSSSGCTDDIPPPAGVGSGSRPLLYGQGLNLQHLQEDTDAGALDLVRLEDSISCNVAQLAKLAQQYDIMITAALAAAAEHADATPAAGSAGAALQQQAAAAGALPASRTGSRKGGFLGPLLDSMRARRAAGKGSGAGEQQAAEPVEYVFMAAGVCSHSNKDKLYSFTAGVPPDVYNSCIHRLLARSACAEQVLWMLSVINARLRYAADVAASAFGAPDAGAAEGDSASAGADGAAGVKQWKAPDKFTRSTTKYWVHPSNILRLKLALTKQLPLLVYGADDPVSSGDITAAAAQGPENDSHSPDQQHKVTSLVSSVYFDGPDLDVYHTRLARLDGARLVRFRYYDQKLTGDAGSQQMVFVEQKTHRDKGFGETSFKERGSLQQTQLPAFLSREVPLEQLLGPNSKKLELMGQVQDFLTEQQQAPVLRTEYLRSAWQAYDDNAVRFSLDEHMLLLREAAPPAAAGSARGQAWCSPLESLLQVPACDAVRFPYAILEVKLADKQAAPAWIHELKTSGVLVEVPRFSKFLHGMALLQPQRIREVPAWFAWREGERVTLPATLDEMWDMTAERRARKELEWQDKQDPSIPPADVATGVAAMLMLLRAPRVAASAAAGVLATDPAAAAEAASKLGLPFGPCYDLTAVATATPHHAGSSAAGGPGSSPAAAPAGQHAVHSYPCHAVDSNIATTSTNSHDSASTPPPAMHGTARDIMQDGQFGCAGGSGSVGAARSGSGGLYRGPGGGMQPLLGLMALPGCRNSFTCSRGPGGYLQGVADSPTAGSPGGRASLAGGSPASVSRSLTVRVPSPHRRSLSSSSLASSDLHASNSSSSLGPKAAEAALPHFTGCSNSPLYCALSPTYPGYPAVHLADGEPARVHGRGHGVQRVDSSGRLHSSCSSSGTTCDSWRLPAAHKHPAAAGGAAAELREADATFRVAENSLKAALWGSERSRFGKDPGASGCPAGLDTAPLGPIRPSDVVVDFSKLAAQAAAPSAFVAAAAAAAAAGRPQVIQVHYTGAVEAVPVEPSRGASPRPSPGQVRELSQLLPAGPPVGGDVVLALGPAGDTVESGAKDQQGVVDGVAADGAGARDGKGKGGRGYRQRMQQWRAALGHRMKGVKGGKGKAAVDGLGSCRTSGLRSESSLNDHMIGFGGSPPRHPTFVKPRTDPKTFFANERTFLQWLQISVLVMMTGLGMLTGSTLAINSSGSCMSNLICSASRISGAIIAPVSILFMVYAIYLYQKRTHQLLTRSTLRYDDARGPWLLTMLLIVVTLVVIVLALEAFKVSIRT